MKRHKGIRVILIIAFIGAAVVIIRQYHVHQVIKSLPTGLQIETDEEYEERLKSEQSDINGMTKYDKYEMGLDIANGSDTDQDGLTDKEEIEVYGSDPLKQSTAGDLYTDGYKVEHGMDVNTYYRYEDELIFINNACQEVTLEANIPSDLYAVVEDVTDYKELNNYDLYKAYHIYNYSGKVSIDLSSAFSYNNVGSNDIVILIEDEFETTKCDYHRNGNVIQTKDSLNPDYEYYIYLANRRRNNL